MGLWMPSTRMQELLVRRGMKNTPLTGPSVISQYSIRLYYGSYKDSKQLMTCSLPLWFQTQINLAWKCLTFSGCPCPSPPPQLFPTSCHHRPPSIGSSLQPLNFHLCEMHLCETQFCSDFPSHHRSTLLSCFPKSSLCPSGPQMCTSSHRPRDSDLSIPSPRDCVPRDDLPFSTLTTCVYTSVPLAILSTEKQMLLSFP